MDTRIVDIATPEGPGRLFVDAAEEPTATLLLGHGAGGGVTAPDLELLARRLPSSGTTVIRFEQPWRTAGRRVAVPPPRLDVGWQAAVEVVLQTVEGPLLFGGRSAGARVACRTAAEFAAAGVVCLAFPLHLPGRPEKSRAHELLTPTVPRLVLQGTRDTFGTPDEIRALPAARRPRRDRRRAPRCRPRVSAAQGLGLHRCSTAGPDRCLRRSADRCSHREYRRGADVVAPMQAAVVEAHQGRRICA